MPNPNSHAIPSPPDLLARLSLIATLFSADGIITLDEYLRIPPDDRGSFVTKKITSRNEIRKNARLVAQASRVGTEAFLFRSLPDELHRQIVGLTGDPKVYNEKNSEKIAEQYLSSGLGSA